MTTKIPIIRSTDGDIVGHLVLVDSFADDLGYAILNKRIYLRGTSKFNGTWTLERVFFETEPVKQLQPGHHGNPEILYLKPGEKLIPPRIALGDVVRMDGISGPQMKVMAFDETVAIVQWFDKRYRPHTARIDTSYLVKINDRPPSPPNRYEG